MDDRNERTAIIGSPSSGGSDRGYAQAHNALNAGVHSPMQDLLHYVLVGCVGVMAVITFILGIYRGLTVVWYGSTYFMLGFSHLILVALESLLILFARNGELENGKLKFFYAIGAITLLHSLFTNIVLFSE